MATKKTTKAAAKKAEKSQLHLMVNPAQPQANFQFVMEVADLEPGQVAELSMKRPGGSVEASSLQASPDGVAQWLLLSTESGDHELRVKAGDKKGTATVHISE